MGIGKKIAAGLRETIACACHDYRRAHVSSVSIPHDVDVGAIRQKLGMNQEEFALRFGRFDRRRGDEEGVL